MTLHYSQGGQASLSSVGVKGVTHVPGASAVFPAARSVTWPTPGVQRCSLFYFYFILSSTRLTRNIMSIKPHKTPGQWTLVTAAKKFNFDLGSSPLVLIRLRLNFSSDKLHPWISTNWCRVHQTFKRFDTFWKRFASHYFAWLNVSVSTDALAYSISWVWN